VAQRLLSCSVPMSKGAHCRGANPERNRTRAGRRKIPKAAGDGSRSVRHWCLRSPEEHDPGFCPQITGYERSASSRFPAEEYPSLGRSGPFTCGCRSMSMSMSGARQQKQNQAKHRSATKRARRNRRKRESLYDPGRPVLEKDAGAVDAGARGEFLRRRSRDACSQECLRPIPAHRSSTPDLACAMTSGGRSRAQRGTP